MGPRDQRTKARAGERARQEAELSAMSNFLVRSAAQSELSGGIAIRGQAADGDRE